MNSCYRIRVKGDVSIENVDMTGREIIRLSQQKGATHNGIHEEEQETGRVKVVVEKKNDGVRKRNARWIL